MEFSWEEIQDHIRLRYGLLPLDLPTACDVCGNNSNVDHAFSCPKLGLVLVNHDDTEKEWGELCARGLNPSKIYYKPHIKISTVQGEQPGEGERTGRG